MFLGYFSYLRWLVRNQCMRMYAADSGESTYEYDLSGRRTKWTLPNSVTASYKYDTNDRLVELTVQKGDEILDKYIYSHDPTGKCTGITYADGSKSIYSLDGVYRLTGDKRVTANGDLIYEEKFTYDAVGNRLSKRRTGLNPQSVDYVYNARNQLVSSSDGKTYTYDANGNCIAIAYPGGVTTMTYDVLNRLIGYSGPNGAEEFTYRGLGWHKWKTSETDTNGDTVITSFQYDGNNIIADYAGPDYKLTHLYATAGLDRQISMTVVNGPNQGNYYYVHDGLGSVRTLTDSTGLVQNRYDYTAFGEPIPDGPENIPQRYGYTGRENNAINGNMNYRNRNYNPAIGRFDRRDPIGYIAGSNLYSYVNNEPNVYTDLFGLIVKIDGSQAFKDKIMRDLREACPELILVDDEVKIPCPVRPMTLACSEMYDAINDQNMTLAYRERERGAGSEFIPDHRDRTGLIAVPGIEGGVPNIGSGGTMWIDPDGLDGTYSQERQSENHPWKSSPSFWATYHEFFHGNEARKGIIKYGPPTSYDFGPPRGIMTIRTQEYDVFKKDDTIRMNNGLHPLNINRGFYRPHPDKTQLQNK